MSKKGLLFNKISIIDILVVLLIGLAGLLAYMILYGGTSPVELVQESNVIEYQVEMRAETEIFANQPVIGQKVFNSSKNFQIGVIKAIEIKEAVDVVENTQTGTFDLVSMPNFYDVILTIEAEAIVNEQSIRVNQQVIRIGEQIPVKGKGFADFGYVVGLEGVE